MNRFSETSIDILLIKTFFCNSKAHSWKIRHLIESYFISRASTCFIKIRCKIMGFEAPSVVPMKNIFWDVTPCFSETSVNVSETTRCYIPDDGVCFSIAIPWIYWLTQVVYLYEVFQSTFCTHFFLVWHHSCRHPWFNHLKVLGIAISFFSSPPKHTQS